MRSVDAYLSRRAARIWPGAVVSCYHEDRTDWQLSRPGLESLGLGDTFVDARRALVLLSMGEAEEATEALGRVRDRVFAERRATERLMRVLAGETDDTYARASDAWHAAHRATDEALGVVRE